MEGGKEDNLLNKIRPPLLEDAGLENCALPPDLIHQAFLKAASAVGSCTPQDDDLNQVKSGPSNSLDGIRDCVAKACVDGFVAKRE